MDLRVLKFCEAVGRLGSFTRAAEEIHIAQPALSTSIAKLERELGVQLFFRMPRGAVPTPEGKVVLARAAEIFEKVSEAKREIDDLADLRSGNLRVGFPPMYGLRYVPTLLSRYSARYPDVEVTAIEGSATEVVRRVDDGSVDIGILETRRIDEAWKSIRIGSDEMVLAVGRKHHLAGKKSVNPADLGDLPMVVLTADFLQRQLLDRFCKDHKVAYRKLMECNFVHMAMQVVADGQGATTLLRSLVDGHRRLVALPFPKPMLFNFQMCWRRDRYYSKTMQALVQLATGP